MILKKLFQIIFILLLCSSYANAAKYTLDISNVDEVGANNRIKYAYTSIEYDVVIVAHGGLYPFVWELTTSPDGMSINAGTGIITWDTPVESGSPHNVTVKVTDAESSTDSESYTVTVSTSTGKFLFVQDGYVGTESGTIAEPYSELNDFWASDHTGKIVYFRGSEVGGSDGIYEIPHVNPSERNGCNRIPFTSTQPLAYLGYPDETIIINGEENGSSGYGIMPQAHDFYISNLTFDEIWAYGIVPYQVDYGTIYNVDFTDGNAGANAGGNYGYVNTTNAASSEDYWYIFNCNFSGAVGGSTGFAGIETYSTSYWVIQDSDFDFNTTNDRGLYFKDDSDYFSVRHNTFGADFDSGFEIYGQAGVDNNDISFNYFESRFYYYPFGNATNTYFYRNTCVGDNQFRDGGGTFTDITYELNVTQNSQSDSGNFEDYTFYRNRIAFVGNITEIEYNEMTIDNNLEGASGMVDSNGFLIGTYRDDYLGEIGWEIGDIESSSIGPGESSKFTLGDSTVIN